MAQVVRVVGRAAVAVILVGVPDPLINREMGLSRADYRQLLLLVLVRRVPPSIKRVIGPVRSPALGGTRAIGFGLCNPSCVLLQDHLRLTSLSRLCDDIGYHPALRAATARLCLLRRSEQSLFRISCGVVVCRGCGGRVVRQPLESLTMDRCLGLLQALLFKLANSDAAVGSVVR